jgi:hypothetical protein
MDAAKACCRALRLSGLLTRQTCAVLAGASCPTLEDDAALRRMMEETGEQAENALWLAGLGAVPDAALQAAAQREGSGSEALLPAPWQEALQRCRAIRARGDCLCVAELALHGDDLVRRGLRGAAVGRAQEFLLQAVLENPEKNTPAALNLLLDEAQRNGTL